MRRRTAQLLNNKFDLFQSAQLSQTYVCNNQEKQDWSPSGWKEDDELVERLYCILCCTSSCNKILLLGWLRRKVALVGIRWLDTVHCCYYYRVTHDERCAQPARTRTLIMTWHIHSLAVYTHIHTHFGVFGTRPSWYKGPSYVGRESHFPSVRITHTTLPQSARQN